MSQGKIEPLIEAAENRAKERDEKAIHELINAIDEEINAIERAMAVKLDEIKLADREFGEKLEQIANRVTKLEAGVAAPAND